jgi:hypothetical protein
MKFPILIIKQKDPSIYCFEETQFGLISKGGEKFYKEGVIIDSEGKVYNIKKSNEIHKASFLQSLKYFQPMYKLTINTEEFRTITINEFKLIVIEHINKHKNYWEKKDLIVDLEKSINDISEYKKIIEFLK